MLIFGWHIFFAMWCFDALVLWLDPYSLPPQTELEYEDLDEDNAFWYKLLSIDSQFILPLMIILSEFDNDSEVFT